MIRYVAQKIHTQFQTDLTKNPLALRFYFSKITEADQRSSTLWELFAHILTAYRNFSSVQDARPLKYGLDILHKNYPDNKY